MATPVDPSLTDVETIAAIATPPGAGGIGIVRISGPGSGAILQQLFHPRRPRPVFPSHRMLLGMVQTLDGIPLDEVLAVFMRAPHSYTREDVVEFHCHGGFRVLAAVLQQVLAAGARPAQAGEFTRRAFLNGRLDLTQAEAVIDLINAPGNMGARMALAQLQGRLGEEIGLIRRAILDLLAHAEVAIDFPDDAEEILPLHRGGDILRDQVLKPLDTLLRRADDGRLWREGAEVVIAGRPNVGKSSLLNALLQEERALVTPVAGTTRDTIEENLLVEGLPVRLVDTAGLRDEASGVEELGIRRARRKADEADLLLLLLDLSRPLETEDLRLRDALAGRPVLLVGNKADLPEAVAPEELASCFPGWDLLRISARDHQGLDGLRQAIFSTLVGERVLDPEGDCAPSMRHRQLLHQTRQTATRLCEGLDTLSVDLVALELHTMLDTLDQILGQDADEDLLDSIFSRFCLGK